MTSPTWTPHELGAHAGVALTAYVQAYRAERVPIAFALVAIGNAATMLLEQAQEHPGEGWGIEAALDPALN